MKPICTAARGLFSIGCLVLVGMAASAKPLPRYHFTEIPIAFPRAINDSGEVVGSDAVPLVYRDGAVSTIVPWSGAATAINAVGEIILFAIPQGANQPSAFVWAGGSAHLLPAGSLPSRASGINDAGLIVGGAGAEGQPAVAVLWSNYCCYRILGTLRDGYSSHAFDINNLDQAVGSSWPTTFVIGTLPRTRAVLFQQGRVEDLGLPQNGIAGTAVAINDRSQIVVNCSVVFGASGRPQAFLYSDGLFTNLGTLPGFFSTQATDINNAGQIVGGSNTGGADHAFFYADGQMYDLNDLTHVPKGWVLAGANGINNRGEIVGVALVDGAIRGFLLTPRGNNRR